MLQPCLVYLHLISLPTVCNCGAQAPGKLQCEVCQVCVYSLAKHQVKVRHGKIWTARQAETGSAKKRRHSTERQERRVREQIRLDQPTARPPTKRRRKAPAEGKAAAAAAAIAPQDDMAELGASEEEGDLLRELIATRSGSNTPVATPHGTPAVAAAAAIAPQLLIEFGMAADLASILGHMFTEDQCATALSRAHGDRETAVTMLMDDAIPSAEVGEACSPASVTGELQALSQQLEEQTRKVAAQGKTVESQKQLIQRLLLEEQTVTLPNGDDTAFALCFHCPSWLRHRLCLVCSTAFRG